MDVITTMLTAGLGGLLLLVLLFILIVLLKPWIMTSVSLLLVAVLLVGAFVLILPFIDYVGLSPELNRALEYIESIINSIVAA